MSVTKGSKWSTVRILRHLVLEVESVFEDTGFTSKADFVADAVRRRLEELMALKTEKLSPKEKESLLLAAEDYYKQHKNFEEEGVRALLQDRYHFWPKWKQELGVLFVCTQKIN